MAVFLPDWDRQTAKRLTAVSESPLRLKALPAEQIASDQTLLADTANGDEQALRALYRAHAPLLYSIIHRILPDPHEAQDALQETFIRIWKQASTFRPERGSPTTWMSFLARNVAIDHLRHQKRRPLVLDENPGKLMRTEEDPASTLERKQLAQSLNTLSQAQRSALELAYFKGCTQSEIADALGMPLGNVKNHLKRGLLKLRQLYHGHD